MQELAGDPELKFAVNQTHTVVRSVAPSESPQFNANVWLAPLPLEGDTETSCGGNAVLTSVTGMAANPKPEPCHCMATPPAHVPGVEGGLGRLRYRVVGAVPLVAESVAPGMPLTIAENAMLPLVALMTIGIAAGA